jgi:HK97 family phage major capsid protein
MKQSLVLQRSLEEAQGKKKALLDAIESSETRSATAAQMQELRELNNVIEGLPAQIQDAQLLEQELLRREEAKAKPTIAIATNINRKGEEADKRSMASTFSYRQVISDVLRGKNPTGVNAEVWQEGEQEARANGIAAEGIALPGFLLGKPEKRTALGVTTAATAGDLVQATIGEFVPYLYPATVLSQLGATFMQGLRDGFDLINQDGGSTATWEGEVDANAETNPTVAKTQVRPKRLGAYTIFSKQLMAQGVIDVEAMVRNDLGIAVGQALEVAAINGSGSAPIPRGILNTSGIGDVAGGTNGAVPTWANLVELESDVNGANGPMGNRAYLTTPGMYGKLKTVTKDSGSGQFINTNGEINGYPAYFTTNVPSNLTKGTSSGVCHAIIFGNFEELYLMNWGGIDLVVNPYSLDTNSQVRVTINTWWDVALRRKALFSAMKDALLS